jgi:uncharacterized repeat protein (TIGR02543 family)
VAKKHTFAPVCETVFIQVIMKKIRVLLLVCLALSGIATTYSVSAATVTFDTQGGSPVPPAQQTSIAQDPFKNTDPVLPLRTGHTFVGWYTASNGGDLITFPFPVTTNTTLYARWTPKEYTVTYHYQDGVTKNVSVTVYHGEKLEKPADPTRNHYVFDGWYNSEANGTDFFHYTPNEPVAGNMHLYAHWHSPNITISFDTNGGTFATSEGAASYIAPKTVRSGDILTRPDLILVLPGYIFDGWDVYGSDYTFTEPLYQSITLVARWRETMAYTITFMLNYDEDIDLYHNIIEVPAGRAPIQLISEYPSRTGYFFRQWHTDKTAFSPYNFDIPINGNVTLYAHWETVLYTVTFVDNTNDPTLANFPQPLTVSYGYSVSLYTNPTRQNYRFDGWYTAAVGGTRWANTNVVTNNLTLYTRWISLDTDVVFEENSGSSTPGAPIVGGYDGGTALDDISNRAVSSAIHYYDLVGNRVFQPVAGRLYILLDVTTGIRRKVVFQ